MAAPRFRGEAGRQPLGGSSRPRANPRRGVCNAGARGAGLAQDAGCGSIITGGNNTRSMASLPLVASAFFPCWKALPPRQVGPWQGSSCAATLPSPTGSVGNGATAEAPRSSQKPTIIQEGGASRRGSASGSATDSGTSSLLCARSRVAIIVADRLANTPRKDPSSELVLAQAGRLLSKTSARDQTPHTVAKNDCHRVFCTSSTTLARPPRPGKTRKNALKNL